jgi:acetolactate synthase-1/3 small subunit
MTSLLLLVRNRHGVLARVASIVSSLGANIESLRANALGGSTWAVIELEAALDRIERERVVRKLGRLVDVLAVQASDPGEQLSVEFDPVLCFNAQIES